MYPGAGQFVDDYDDKDDAFEESVTNESARNVPETPEKLSARDKDPQYLTHPQADHYAPDPMLQSEERFHLLVGGSLETIDEKSKSEMEETMSVQSEVLYEKAPESR